METIDLRSDRVTRPTAAMRAAMAKAEVGDDVYGEDPSVLSLEAQVAGLLGKEAAVWVPTGVMANQLAIGSLAGMGEEVICERNSHVVNYEGGAISALWGAQSLVIDGPAGIFTADAVRAVLRQGDDVHDPRQRVLAVENTHNRGGGSIWPLDQLREVCALARTHGLAVHLAGPRLWNAHVATGIPLRDYAACADTVSVCLSKGLGAPAGSLTATTAARMPTLRRLRKRLGGGHLRPRPPPCAAARRPRERAAARVASLEDRRLALRPGRDADQHRAGGRRAARRRVRPGGGGEGTRGAGERSQSHPHPVGHPSRRPGHGDFAGRRSSRPRPCAAPVTP